MMLMASLGNVLWPDILHWYEGSPPLIAPTRSQCCTSARRVSTWSTPWPWLPAPS